MAIPSRISPSFRVSFPALTEQARRFALLILTLAALAVSACSGNGGDDGGNGDGNGDGDGDGKEWVATLELVPSEVELTVGELLVLVAQKAESEFSPPQEINSADVEWVSSDEEVATVEEGVVVAVAPGEAIISAVFDGLTAETAVTVRPLPPTIQFEVDTVVLRRVGATAWLRPVAMDVDETVLADDPADFSYESTDESVVTVDDTGQVTAHALGEASINVTFENVVGVVWVRVEHTIVELSFPEDPVALNYVGHRITLEPVGLDEVGDPVDQELTGIVWEGGNEAVAWVDNDGRVTAVDDGTTTITATWGDVEGEVTVVVRQKATILRVVDADAFEPVDVTFLEFDRVGLIARLSVLAWDAAEVRIPVTAADVEWTSTNPLVASVNQEGVVTAVGRGEATVRVQRDDLSVLVPVTVSQTPTVIEFSPQTILFDSLGQTTTFIPTVRDGYGDSIPTTSDDFRWTSTNEQVATVNESGVVTAVSAGSATIRAWFETLVGNVSVTVDQVPVHFDVSPKDAILSLGQSFTPVVAARDAGGSAIELSGGAVSWASSNESVATVSPSGLVTAHNTGFARVEVKYAGFTSGIDLFVPDGGAWWSTLEWRDESPYVGENWSAAIFVDADDMSDGSGGDPGSVQDVLLAGSSMLRWGIDSGERAPSFDKEALSPLSNPVFDVLGGVMVDGELLLLSSDAIWRPGETGWIEDHASTDLRAIDASTDVVVAVGGSGQLLHRTELGWEPSSSPIESDVVAVHVVSDSRIWAASANGEVLRWDGTEWFIETVLPMVPVGLVENSEGVLFVLGISGGSPVVHRRAGSDWSSSSAPLQATPTSVDVTDDGVLLITTDTGQVLEWDGEWSVAFSSRHPLSNVRTGASGIAIAVGQSGTVLVREGDGWSVASGNRGSLRAAFAASREHVFAVGEKGTFLVRDDVGWRALESDITEDFHAVWASSSSLVWAVGAAGRVARFDGDEVAAFPSPTAVDLHAV